VSDQLRALALPSLFPTDGELRMPGLAAPVTVRRDAWGVPTIEAASLDDLWFANGLVAAGERLFQIDLTLRAAAGRLAEMFGERSFDDDRFARTIGLSRAAATHVRTRWSDLDHAMHGRFRAGLRAWIDAAPALPIEYALLDLVPDIPDDPEPYAGAFALLAWSLSNNWESELLRAELDRRLGPDVTDRLLPLAPAARGQGSNDWAVAGARTASGAPLLANDPHLVVGQPGVWLELHLRAPGYEARGVALPFSPGIILGATPHHAWGVTNVTGDVQDLYEERLDVGGTAALHGDAWEPLTVHREEIVVRGEPEPRIVEVLESRHGPILTHGVAGILHTRYRELDTTFALRWTGHDGTIEPSLALAVAGATDIASFRRAVQRVACPGQNFVYADVEGTIGYQATGTVPIRRAGDGTRPVPGWTDEHEWIGWIPPEELPFDVDPARGFVATANDDIRPLGYPYLITKDFHRPHRVRRITDLLEGRDDHDVASMRRIQLDTWSEATATTLPLLLALAPRDARQTEALTALAAWDGDLRAESHEAALFNTWSAAIAGRALRPKLGDGLFAAYIAWRETFQCAVLPDLLHDGDGWLDDDLLAAALDDAIEAADGATWGELHTLRIAHPLASIPGLDGVFTAAAVPLGGDEQTVAQAGFDGLEGGYRPAVIPSWRVVWDLGDLERSAGVVPTGVSGNPASPHWNDQVGPYIRGEAKPYGFATQGVETLTIVPA
jgi:penicillin amidase